MPALQAISHENVTTSREAGGASTRTVHRSLSTLDLFCGAGGLTLGLEAAGFRPVVAVERGDDACATYSSLFPAATIEPRPVELFDFRPYHGVDLVVGGPPCQPFSSGGKGLAGDDDRDMIPQFIRAVAEARPRAFLMENVPALFGATHQHYLSAVLRQLAGLGYSLSVAVLNAAAFGVPQKRRRGFVVGLRSGGRYAFPAATHGPGFARPFVPAGAVLGLGDTCGEAGGSHVIYAKKPDLRPSPYDGLLFNGGGRPIDLSAPCHTILASAGGNKTHFIDTLNRVPAYHAHLRRGGKPRVGRLEGARRLTLEESAAIQTFPPATRFSGTKSSQYAQIGNAVPPLLAAALGRGLYELLA